MAIRITRSPDKPLAAKPSRRAPTPTTPEGQDAVEILKGDILQLMEAANKKSVVARAEVGHKLLAIKQALTHGSWGPYLAKNLPFTARSAERAIALYHFSQQQPALFDKLAPLGIAKAYFLIGLAPAALGALLGAAHLVPSAGVVLTPGQMTFRQLFEVVQGPAAADAGEMIARSLGRHLRAVGRAVDAAVAHKQWISQDDALALHDALLDAAAKVARAFRLRS